MNIFIALLRAVNVGGTGKLPMQDLKSLCEKSGFIAVKTYIASGNVVFKSKKSGKQVKELLESALENYADKPIVVFVRTPDEMAEIIANNPFPDAEPNRMAVVFLDVPPSDNVFAGIVGRKNEKIQSGKREIYVHYVDGMGVSKLKIPEAKAGTTRNMNTITKLLGIAQSLPAKD